VTLVKGKKQEHLGIMVELIGVIENCIDKTMTSQFLYVGRDLEPPG